MPKNRGHPIQNETACAAPSAVVVQAAHCGTPACPMNDAPRSATAAWPPTMKNPYNDVLHFPIASYHAASTCPWAAATVRSRRSASVPSQHGATTTNTVKAAMPKRRELPTPVATARPTAMRTVDAAKPHADARQRNSFSRMIRRYSVSGERKTRPGGAPAPTIATAAAAMRMSPATRASVSRGTPARSARRGRASDGATPGRCARCARGTWS